MFFMLQDTLLVAQPEGLGLLWQGQTKYGLAKEA